MEIYQDMTPRCGVATPSKTVFSKANRSSRKALTPHNRKVSPMQALRRRLKDPNAPRGISGSAKAVLSPPSSSEVSKTSVQFKNPVLLSDAGHTNRVLDKENYPNTASTPTVGSVTPRSSVTTNDATPNGTASFRRSLRATLSPPIKNQQPQPQNSKGTHKQSQAAAAFTPLRTSPTYKAYAASHSKMSTAPHNNTNASTALASDKPSSRMNGSTNFQKTTTPNISIAMPQTPKSLLRTELNFADDDSDSSLLDESLLVSPNGAMWQSTNMASKPASVIENDIRDGLPQPDTSLVILSPEAAEQVHKVQHQLRQDSRRTPESAKAVSEAVFKPSSSENSPSFPQPRILEPSSAGKSLQPIAESNESSDTQKENKATTSRLLSRRLGGASKGADAKGMTARLGPAIRNEQALQKTLAQQETKNLSNSKSVCLDLSDLFLDTTMPSRPPPPLSSRVDRKEVESSKKAVSTVTASRRTLLSAPSQKPKPSRANAAKAKKFATATMQKASQRTPKRVASTTTDSVVESSPNGSVAFTIALDPAPSLANKARRTVPSLTSSTVIAKRANTSRQSKPENPQLSWADKQSETFTSWLNYTFDPMEDAEQAEMASVGRTSGLRALIIHQRMAQFRLKANDIFQSAEMKRIQDVITAEIKKGRLAIRTDRDVYADLSLREQITRLLLSYSMPWLRLALEVIFGKNIDYKDSMSESERSMLSPKSRIDAEQKSARALTGNRMRHSLKTFLVEHILSDATILAKYTRGRCNVPSGKFEKLYRAEMRSVVLYRLIVLVAFLDRIKMANILDQVPRLFTKKSNVKSSRGVLQELCRACLNGEGDFLKHLSRIGLKVVYKQEPVDEVEFRIVNLATDLRDGSCLTRLTEILTQSAAKSLMVTLRLPAVSRLQKLHNVNVALKRLQEFGINIPSDINSHHIIDGHREIVLKLMWSVISHSCMGKLLKNDQVEEEIRRVRASNRVRFKLAGRSLEDIQVQDKALDTLLPLDATPETVLKHLLLRWCQAVCSCHHLLVTDFTHSFADGEALCLLINYYHPYTLRRSEILPTSKCLSDTSTMNLTHEKAILNERSNCKLAGTRASDLGGIPNMLPVTDSENAPNEQSMLLCLSYLCSRLMESSQEILSCILIQKCYRKYYEKILLERKESAAWIIFQTWTQMKDNYYDNRRKKYIRSVATLESFFLAHRYVLFRLRDQRLDAEYKCNAATDIQKMFRGMIGRWEYSDLLQQQNAAIVIQCNWRCISAKQKLADLHEHLMLLTKIQSVWRGHVCRLHFELKRECAVEIQRVTRKFLRKQHLIQCDHAALIIQQAWWTKMERREQENSVLRIQTTWRGFVARQELGQRIIESFAASQIQRSWRGWFCRLNFDFHVQSIIAIQKIVRGHAARKQLPIKVCKNAAIKIQALWRGFLCQIQYNLDCMDIVTVQSIVRRHLAFNSLDRRYEAVSLLQCAFRSAIARRNLNHRLTMHLAAIQIQSFIRSTSARYTFCKILLAAIKIQAVCRAFVTKTSLSLQRASATVIQKKWRQCCFIQSRQHAATVLQRAQRGRKQLRRYQDLKSATVLLQKIWRGAKYRACLSQHHFAATRIQAAWRGFYTNLVYSMEILEIIICQNAVRRWRARIEAEQRMQGIIKIQSGTRKRLAVLQATRLRSVRRHAAIIIQRSMRVHRRETTKHNAARLIQSACRRCIEQARFIDAVHSITHVQSVWRGAHTRLACTRNLQAAITIQTACRKCLARMISQNMKQEHAATVIQMAWIIHQDEQIRKFAATMIQRIFRGFTNSTKFQQTINAACVIQKLWRGKLSRLSHKECVESATKVQTVWRKWCTRMIFEMDRSDIIICQSACRRWRSRLEGNRRRMAIGVLQRGIRSCQAVSVLYQLRNERAEQDGRLKAIVFCQSLARRRLVITQKHRSIKSALKVQAYWRARSAAASYNKLRVLTTICQARVRGKAVLMNFNELREHAKKVQSTWRRRSEQIKYQQTRFDIVMIQSVARQLSAKKIASHRCQSVASIQKAACSFLFRRRVFLLMNRGDDLGTTQTTAATRIQSLWRRRVAIDQFRADVWRVILFQSLVRRCLARNLFTRRTGGILCIQRTLRCGLARRRLRVLSIQRDSDRQTNLAAIQIKALIRGHQVRLAIGNLQKQATIIQSVYRGFVSQACFQLHLADIVTTQSCVRRWSARKQLLTHKSAATVIQIFFRRELAIQRLSHLRTICAQHDQEFGAARNIQSAWRGTSGRIVARQHAAARRIQKTWRCYGVHVDFIISLLGVIAVQSSMRGFLCRQRVKRIRSGVIKLQSTARGFLVRKTIANKRRSCIHIQSCIRMYQTRQIFSRTQQAVVRMQRHTRGFLTRIDIKVATFAACEIQRIWRGYDCFIDFALQAMAVVKIQAAVRRRIAAFRFKQMKLEQWAKQKFFDRKAIVIQRSFRMHLLEIVRAQSALVIQDAIRSFLHRKFVTRVARGIKRLQAVARARMIRRRSPKKFALMTRRIEKANQKARAQPKLRLGFRTEEALRVLQSSSRLSEIMAAVTTLEATTRLSFVCCEAFTMTKAVEILLALIRSCNRSLPHVELLHCTLLTLHNVALHDELLPRLAYVEAGEVFLDLVQMFRDKDGIFCLAVALLDRIVRCNADIAALCASRENQKRLKSVYNLCARKVRTSSAISRSSTRSSKGKKFLDVRVGVKQLQAILSYIDKLPFMQNLPSDENIAPNDSDRQAPQHFRF